MESRFRKFIGAKREKTEPQAVDIDLQSSIYRAVSLQWSTPEPKPKPSPKKHVDDEPVPEEDPLELQAISYDAVTAGKAPTFGFELIKGNGPVKLQTSRRLSSGEVEETASDMQSILEDIRDGDYIVGRKNLYDSRSRSAKGNKPPTRPVWSNRDSFIEAFQSPRPAPRTPTSPTSFSSNECSEDWYPITRSAQDRLATSSPSTSSSRTSYSQHHAKSPVVRRGSQLSNTSTATSPSIHVEEQNATIAALWKAEYNRLVDMYGRDHVEQQMPHLNASSTQAGSCSTRCVRAPGMDLEPLPHPSTGNTDKTDSFTKRLSKISATSTSNDDSSDAMSDQRVSRASSSAASSAYTAQTNLTDPDTVVTREDIRKIINEMRSTYLRALDTQTPPSPKIGPTTRRKQRSKFVASNRRPPVKPLAGSERQTWHGTVYPGDEASSTDSFNIRSASNPAVPFGRLSPIEASPPPRSPKRPKPSLQRADSTTLGNMLTKIRNSNKDPGETALDSKPGHEREPVTPTKTPSSSDDSFVSAQTGVKSNSSTPPVNTQLRWQQPAVKPDGNFF